MFFDKLIFRTKNEIARAVSYSFRFSDNFLIISFCKKGTHRHNKKQKGKKVRRQDKDKKKTTEKLFYHQSTKKALTLRHHILF